MLAANPGAAVVGLGVQNDRRRLAFAGAVALGVEKADDEDELAAGEGRQGHRVASDEAAYMTGAELNIAGGLLAGSAAAPG